jgi:hypothetical protein
MSATFRVFVVDIAVPDTLVLLADPRVLDHRETPKK